MNPSQPTCPKHGPKKERRRDGYVWYDCLGCKRDRYHKVGKYAKSNGGEWTCPVCGIQISNERTECPFDGPPAEAKCRNLSV